MEKLNETTKSLIDRIVESSTYYLFVNNTLLTVPPEIKDKMPLNLSPTLRTTLVYIRFEGPMTMGDIARHNGVTKQRATQFITALEKYGLVRRFHKENNLINVYVELTEKGKKLQQDYDDMRWQHWYKIFSSVGSDEDLQKLLAAWETINCYMAPLDKRKELYGTEKYLALRERNEAKE